MRSFLLFVFPLVSTTIATLDFKRSNLTYPPSDEIPSPISSWISLYDQVKSQGLIPGFAPSYLVNGNPTYGGGIDGLSNQVCSWTTSHCFGLNDVSSAPDGSWGLSFDDGPLPPSSDLYSFLKSQNQRATHFMIGSNIQDYPNIFKQAVDNGDHIAVHTWSHPYMTTMTDSQILGELGWTIQIIHDQTGMTPTFWRPPYGDVDNRVRAIAEHVFNLQTVIWNQDSNDWCLKEGGGSECSGYGPNNQQDVVNELNVWIDGPKSPGIITLQHELSTYSVHAFIQMYPFLLARRWKVLTIPDLFKLPWYKTVAVITNSTSTITSSSTTSSVPSSTFLIVTSSSTTSIPSSPTSISSNSSSTAKAKVSSAASSSINLSFGVLVVGLLFCLV